MNLSKPLTLRIIKLSFVLLLFLLNGCSGCSPSSRRSKAQSNNVRNIAVKSNSESQLTLKRRGARGSVSRSSSTLSSLYDRYKQSVFLVYTFDGENYYQGSGFFVSKSGVAVSNYHVFEGTSKGSEVIETVNGEKFKITQVLKKSEENDYIIFKVDIGAYNISNPIPVASHKSQIGEDVFAIGNPKGLESTLSKGIISSFRESNTLIQTTTEITNGSSGGPLLNMRGEVIGITTSGMGEANINFAVNILKLNLENYF